MDCADAAQPDARGLDAERHPDQHAYRGRSRRRDEDGPPGVDRHVPRIADRDRDADEQQRPRPSARIRRSIPRTRGRRTSTARSSSGGTARTAPSRPSAGTSSRCAATRRIPRTARRSSATSTARRTASMSRRAGGCGSRRTSRAAPSTPARYAGFGNNQMLCADLTTGETRRFLVGPNVCEITGAFVTPDERTMFVGIQHPGEAPSGANDPANAQAIQLLAGGGRGRPSALCVHRHHEG